LRVEARQFRGHGFEEYDTGIFFNIPWVNPAKYRSATAEARQARESTERELENLRLETAGAVREQLSRIETFHHHYMLYRDRLLPLARQSVEAARAAYEGSRGGLLDLLTALRALRDTDAELQEHLADYLSALAELESIIGTDPEQRDGAPPIK